MFKENLRNHGTCNGYYMNNLKQLKIGKANVCTTIFLEISLYVVYGFNSVETRLYFDGKEN